MYILSWNFTFNPKVLFIPFWAFVVLDRYLGLQLFLEIPKTFYECTISLELCRELIFKKFDLLFRNYEKI